MFYAILIVILLGGAILLMNVRVRLDFGPGRKLLFIGLGRTGPQFDITNRKGIIRICGFKMKEFEIESGGKRKLLRSKSTEKPKPKRERQLPPIGQMMRIAGESGKALFEYLISLIKAVSVEELEAKIEAGFESPDLTGMAYGYYQAALGAAPAVVGLVQFTPVWTGGCFKGEVKASVAIPLYRILFRTLVLVWRLPSRDLLKMAIGKKKGAQDG